MIFGIYCGLFFPVGWDGLACKNLFYIVILFKGVQLTTDLEFIGWLPGAKYLFVILDLYNLVIPISTGSWLASRTVKGKRYEMKKYLYNIYFDFRSVTRFANIWLETMAYFILTASQVDVIVMKHSWFRISFWVLGSSRPFTPLPSQEVFGFHHATVICFRYTGCWISDFMIKSIKDSLGLLNPSWLFSQLGKLSLKSMWLFVDLSSRIWKFLCLHKEDF